MLMISAIIIAASIYGILHDEEKRRIDNARSFEVEKMERVKFNEDFRDIADLTYRKNLAVYEFITKLDKQIVEKIKTIVLFSGTTNEYRRSLETQLINKYQLEIQLLTIEKMRIENLIDALPNSDSAVTDLNYNHTLYINCPYCEN